MKRLLFIAAFAATTAHAEFKDGNTLYKELTSDVYFNQGVALGYITGVADSTMGIMFCAPSNVTAGQIQDMVKNYLTNTPAIRHVSADVIVNYVLKTAWPCAKKNSKI